MARPSKGRGRPTAVRSVSKGAGTPTGARRLTPEIQARLSELLAAPPDADVAARFGEIAAEAPAGAIPLIDALGSSQEEAAGRVVAALAVGAADKEQRKAARRALHKLRSAGIAVAVPAHTAPTSPTPSAAETTHVVRALVSPPDGVGSRLLWLLLERSHGSLTMFNLAINDVVGVKDIVVEETTRRRFERQLEAWTVRSELRSIDVPIEYGLSLLSEALALNAESQFPLPRDFVIRRPLLGELPPPPTSALIHQHVSRGQIFLMPNLLEESAGLLEGEPELRGWVFAYKEVQPFAREYRQTEESRLLLTSEPRETRLERVIANAVDTLLTPEMRRAFRRRLEETAYVFWQTGRERSARQAVAAAFAIGDTGSLRTHPLLRTIVQRSIEMAMEVDRSGMPLPPGANRTARDRI